MRHKRIFTLQALLLRSFLPVVSVSALLLAALVYNMLHETILRQFDDRLIATSAITGAMINPADHDGLIAAVQAGGASAELEADARYLRNVEPMRRIREKLGLTYLYSQVIGGPDEVFYILDGTDGEDHTPIGESDSMTAETMAGLRAIAADQGVYVSPVEYQAQWGLLKTAAAPVYRADGQVAGTAGADVNVTVLQVATQNILFQSALIGMGSIILCLFATLFIMRRVARPIARLTQEALRLAAGDYRPPEHHRGPREVAALRSSLALLGAHVTQDLRRAEADVAKHLREESERRLLAVDGADGGPTVLVDDPERTLLWIRTSDGGLEGMLASRAMMRVARKMAVRPVESAAALERLSDLADGEYGALLHFERAARRLSLMGSAPIDLIIDGAAQRLAPGGSVVLAPEVSDVRYRGSLLPLGAAR